MRKAVVSGLAVAGLLGMTAPAEAAKAVKTLTFSACRVPTSYTDPSGQPSVRYDNDIRVRLSWDGYRATGTRYHGIDWNASGVDGNTTTATFDSTYSFAVAKTGTDGPHEITWTNHTAGDIDHLDAYLVVGRSEVKAAQQYDVAWGPNIPNCPS